MNAITNIEELPADLSRFIPEQKIGQSNDTFSHLALNDRNDADKLFKEIKNRLLNINQWNEYATLTNARFTLMDSNGNFINRLAAIGDYVKVVFSGMQKLISDSEEHVHIGQIISLKHGGMDVVIMKVYPCADPTDNKQEVAHFFNDEASNTFLLYRTTTHIQLSVHGRNEIPNTGSGRIRKKIRNLIFAVLAVAGISKIQWKSLAHGLLHF